MFAIPTLSVEAQWYPAAAIPLLFVTILVAALSGKAVSLWERRSLIAYQPIPSDKATFGKLFERPKKEAEEDLEKGPDDTPAEPSVLNKIETPTVAGESMVGLLSESKPPLRPKTPLSEQQIDINL